MPSPIGHALAGVAVALTADLFDHQSARIPAATSIGVAAPCDAPWIAAVRPSLTTTTVVCATLAALPDIDLLLPLRHRTVTHSVLAVAVVMIVAMVVTDRVICRRVRKMRALGAHPDRSRAMTGPLDSANRLRIVGRVGVLCAAAYASHLLLDWLAVDHSLPYGLQLFWPISDHWYLSGWDVFRGTERRQFLSAASMLTNLKAALQEIATLGPVVAALWAASRWRKSAAAPSRTLNEEPRVAAQQ